MVVLCFIIAVVIRGWRRARPDLIFDAFFLILAIKFHQVRSHELHAIQHGEIVALVYAFCRDVVDARILVDADMFGGMQQRRQVDAFCASVGRVPSAFDQPHRLQFADVNAD